MWQLNSIRVRLTVWYVLILGIILIGFSIALYQLVRASQLHELDAALRATADVLEIRSHGSGTSLDLQMPPNRALPLHGNVYYRVLGPEGGVITQSDDLPPHAFNRLAYDQEAIGRGVGYFEDVTVPGGPSLRVLTQTLRPAENGTDASLVLQMGTSLARLEASLSRLRFLLIVIVPITLLVTSIGGVFLANRLLSPISRMVEEAQRISSHSLHRRLPLRNLDDELGRLAATLNNLFDRLERAFKNQQRFIADASHELRTPLASMRAEIEIARRHSRTREEYQALLASLLEETEHLASMAEHLLMLSQSDSGELTIHWDEFNLGTLCQRAYERLIPLAKQQGIALNMRGSQSMQLQGDAELLEHVLFILVDNSIKFTTAGGWVEIAYGIESQSTLIEVIDNGPGIPEEHRAHLFERFYRIDKARSRRSAGSGAGLGLSIAKSIVEAHRGTIEVRSSLGRGSTFTVRLPFVPSRSINTS